MSQDLNILIKNCIRRDIHAQRAMYDLYVDRLYYTVFRYVNNPFYIENILQDIFLKVFNKLETFDSSKASFNTWITTIAIRESLNHIRKRNLTFIPLDNTSANISAEIDPLISKMEAQDLIYLIATIPEKLRIVFNLYEIDGYHHSEIKEILGITASTSRAYLSRAKQHIQNAIHNKISLES